MMMALVVCATIPLRRLTQTCAVLPGARLLEEKNDLRARAQVPAVRAGCAELEQEQEQNHTQCKWPAQR